MPKDNDSMISSDLMAKLAKAATQYAAMRAVSGVTGGGMSGYLMSMVAMEGMSKLFDRKSGGGRQGGQSAADPKQTQSGPPEVVFSDQSMGELADRIGDAVAKAVENIRDGKLQSVQQSQPAQTGSAQPAGNPNDIRHNPLLDEAFGKPAGSNQTGQSGPKLPRPGENQSAREYVRSLTQEQLQFLRGTGRVNPAPAASTAATGAEAGAVNAGRAAVLRSAAGAAASGAGAGAAGTGAAAAGGTAAAGSGGAAAAGAAAAGGPVGLAIAGVAAVGYAFYELAKAGKDLAYEQEQHSRKLGEVNATIGSQNAELDARRTFRNIERGDATSGTNAMNLAAIDRFERSIEPLVEIADNIKNVIASEVMNTLADFADVAKQGLDIAGKQYDAMLMVAKLINPAAGLLPSSEQIRKKYGSDGEGQTFGDFLQEVERKEAEKRMAERDLMDATRKAAERNGRGF